MKHNFKLLLVVLMLLCNTVATAHDFEVDGIYYNIASNKIVEVTYRGGYYNQYLNEYTGNVVIPSSVTYNGTTYSVISIRNYAFYGCAGLTSVTIPNSVTIIDHMAFYGCTGLTSVTIGESVTSIGDNAFEGCAGLTSVTIPNSVTSIGEYAFYRCSGLTTVIIGSGVTSIDHMAFKDCSRLKTVIIGSGVTSIGARAFEGCTNLKTVINCSSSLSLVKGWDNNGYVAYYANKIVNVPNAQDISIEGYFVFAVKDGVNTLAGYLGSATEIALPANYKGENYVIGEYAFHNCTGLTSVTIPNSVTRIGAYAFHNCTGLTSVTIPNSVTRIDDWAFNACTNLKTVTNYSSLNIVKGSSGNGCVAYYADRVIDLQDASIIGDFVFDVKDGVITLVTYIGSSSEIILPELNIGYNIGYVIGEYAFYGCTGLTSVTIGNSVTSIGDNAFRSCSGLKTVIIGSGVTSIGARAFGGCTNLKTVINCSSSLSLVKGWDNNGYVAYYANKIVNVPNAQDASIEGDFVFAVKDGVNTLAGYLGSATEIALPANYKGKNYVIGEGVFSGNTNITIVSIPASVTSIGSSAFSGCSGLTSITIPNSVTSIGEGAFNGCYGLTSVTIGESVKSIGAEAFRSCSGLTSVTIGNGVTSIGECAFSGCSGLTSVIIPASVTSIGYYAFEGCTNLKTVINCSSSLNIVKGSYDYGWVAYYAYRVANVPNVQDASIEGDFVFAVKDGVNTLAGYLGSASEITLPDSYKGGNYVIGESAFSGCTFLTSVVIPNSVTSIGVCAFYGCAGITNVTIPNSVTSIGGSAFEGCTGLTNVTIPNSVTSIGSWAFNGCTGLTSVTIPNSVTSIGSWAFNRCYGLTSVIIGNSVTSIGEGAFNSCTGLTSVTIGNSVTSIGEAAFAYCSSLTSVTIPNSVTSIGGGAFAYCSGLTSVTIGESVTSIDYRAFYGCTGLTSVTIGESVTSIGSWAFEGCVGLKTVINCSSLNIVAGSTENGYVAYYADRVVNAPNGFIFEVKDDVNTLTRYLGSSTEITLPDAYKDDNYVIGEGAFKDNTSITSVTIGSGVTSIGSEAFYGCTNLKTVINCSSLNIVAGSTENGYVAYYADRVVNVLNGFIFEVKDDVNTLTGYLGSSTEITLPDAYKGENYVIGARAFVKNTSITSVTIGSGVTSIGEYAFLGCSGLTSVTIGSGVTYIGQYAFSGCNNLTAVHISDLAAWCNISFSDTNSNPLYYAKDLYLNGEIVADLVIPDGVTEIKDYAFYGCSGLTSVTIPNSVTSIGAEAFRNCTGLASVTIGSGVTSIGADAFRNCTGLASVTIGSGVTSIGNYAFRICTALTEIYVESLTPATINYYTFYGLYSQATLYVPAGAKTAYEAADYWKNFTNIVEMESEEEVIGGEKATWSLIDGVLTISGTGAMADYEANSTPWNEYRSDIISVVIEEGITSIGDCAFYDCTALTSVTIPNSVTSIGEEAFYGCTGLTAVHISDLAAWCNISFANYDSNPLYKAANLYLSGEKVTSLDIPWGVTSIKPYVFRDFFSLTSVTIPGSVTSIGEGSFRGCIDLASVVIPNSVTSIGDDAFYDCYALASIKIGSGVTSIGYHAFRYCIGLTEIFVESLTPATINYYTFEGLYEQATLYVPVGAKTAYEAADYWKNFTNIVEMEFTGIDEVVDEVKGENSKVKDVYDLSGRKVTNPTKGIYIVNGKKVLLK